jgi:hypothetical protein
MQPEAPRHDEQRLAYIWLLFAAQHMAATHSKKAPKCVNRKALDNAVLIPTRQRCVPAEQH